MVTRHIHVAIIGAGVMGLTLAASLAERSISFTVYEAGSTVGKGGVGFAFNPATLRALGLCGTRVLKAFESVVVQHPLDERRGVFFDVVDGYNDSRFIDTEGLESVGDARSGRFFTLANDIGMAAVHRQSFCEALLARLPEGSVKLQKKLFVITGYRNETQTLTFDDCSEVEADVVIACDGMASRVRTRIRPKQPATYTGMMNVRSVVSLEKAIRVLGEEDALNPTTFVGPDAHIVTVPYPSKNMFCFSAFLNTEPIEAREIHRSGIESTFAAWLPRIHRIISLLPDLLRAWPVSDTLSAGAIDFNHGRICLAGEAAHGMTPYLASGASSCITDAAILACLLSDARPHVESAISRLPDYLSHALSAYSKTLAEETSYIVAQSRIAGELHQFRPEEPGPEPLNWLGLELGLRLRFARVWDVDVLEQLEQARDHYKRNIADEIAKAARENI